MCTVCATLIRMTDVTTIVAIAVPLVGFLLNILALLIVPRNRKPTAGMAWLLVIFLLPYVGWILFLIIGTNKLPKSRRDTQIAFNKTIDARVGHFSDSIIGSVPDKYQPIARLATSLGHLPPIHGTTTDFMTEYDDTIAAIVKDIRSANTSIYIEYFIFTLDDGTTDLFDALKDAANRGVEIRVLYDWFASKKYPGYAAMRQFLDDCGIRHHGMLPFKFSFKDYQRIDLRNHRKLIVIDHKVGYIGSQNLIRCNYSREDSIIYDELVVRLTGSVIAELEALFAHDWSVESGEPLQTILTTQLESDLTTGSSLMQVLPSGPSYRDENNLKVFTLGINRAEHEIFIANPYFVPSEPLLSAIVTAAKRGVKVRMINSEVMDQWMVGHAQRSYYEELLRAGVEIYLYRQPILLHSKFMIIDNELGFVGSSNLDIRSFELDHELSLIVYGQKSVARMAKVRDLYLKRTHRIRLSDWQKRKASTQLLDNIARLTSNVQ